MPPKRAKPDYHLERATRGVALQMRGRPAVKQGGEIVVVHRGGEMPIDLGVVRRLPATTGAFRRRLQKVRGVALNRQERRVVRRLPVAIGKVRGYLGVIIRDAGPKDLPTTEKILSFRRAYATFATMLMAASRGSKERLSGPHVDEFERIIRQPLDNGAKNPHPTTRYYKGLRQRAGRILDELDRFEERLNERKRGHQERRAERRALESVAAEIPEGERNLPPRALGKLYLKLVKQKPSNGFLY